MPVVRGNREGRDVSAEQTERGAAQGELATAHGLHDGLATRPRSVCSDRNERGNCLDECQYENPGGGTGKAE